MWTGDMEIWWWINPSVWRVLMAVGGFPVKVLVPLWEVSWNSLECTEGQIHLFPTKMQECLYNNISSSNYSNSSICWTSTDISAPMTLIRCNWGVLPISKCKYSSSTNRTRDCLYLVCQEASPPFLSLRRWGKGRGRDRDIPTEMTEGTETLGWEVLDRVQVQVRDRELPWRDTVHRLVLVTGI